MHITVPDGCGTMFASKILAHHVEGAMTSGASRRDSIVWASHYRAQASEHLKRADAAFDERMEAHYRFLAQRFLKLAEAEEFASNH
jgi:hypothetical protein